MPDRAKQDESLADWANRNGIDLGDGSPDLIGYWCRVSGVPLEHESIRRYWDARQVRSAKDGWRDADTEIRAELIEETEATYPTQKDCARCGGPCYPDANGLCPACAGGSPAVPQEA